MKKLLLYLCSTGWLVGCANHSVIQPQVAAPAPRPERSLAHVLSSELKRNFVVSNDCRRAMCEADLSFVLGQKGDFQNLKIVKSSGNRRFDQNAITALKKVNPVSGVPNHLIGQTVTIHFDSNVPG